MRLICCALLMAVAFVTVVSSSASALAPFRKAFDDKYVKDSGDDAFKEAFKKEGCNTCHVKGKSDKKLRNDYGMKLAELIPGNAKERLDQAADKKAETAKLLEELDKAFEKAADEENEDGVKFGDLLKEHKLPGKQPE
ncbi:MAG: hypothetical protein R3E01_28060 [Pirellulaceae bacterium]|nr:hypothetical protein [Planctomycetales bacterium]